MSRILQIRKLTFRGFKCHSNYDGSVEYYPKCAMERRCLLTYGLYCLEVQKDCLFSTMAATSTGRHQSQVAGIIQNLVHACVRHLMLAVSWEPQSPSTGASPRGCSMWLHHSSQHGSGVPGERSPDREDLVEAGSSSQLLSEVTQRHFHGTTLTETILKSYPGSRGGKTDSTP